MRQLLGIDEYVSIKYLNIASDQLHTATTMPVFTNTGAKTNIYHHKLYK